MYSNPRPAHSRECGCTDHGAAIAAEVGSDPNSGQGIRAGQPGFLGSDRNLAKPQVHAATRSGAPEGTSEGWANLCSDPNNPAPIQREVPLRAVRLTMPDLPTKADDQILQRHIRGDGIM